VTAGISHDDKYMVVVGQVYNVWIYSVATGEQLHHIKINNAIICVGLKFSLDNENFHICTRNGHVLTIHAPTGALLGARSKRIYHEKGVATVLFLALSNCEYAVGVGMQGDVALWDIGPPTSVVPFIDDNALSDEPPVGFWNSDEDKPESKKVEPLPMPMKVYCTSASNRVLISNNEQILLLATNEATLKIFHTKSGELINRNFTKSRNVSVATNVCL